MSLSTANPRPAGRPPVPSTAPSSRRAAGALRRVAVTFAAALVSLLLLAPTARAGADLTITTPYPAVTVAPGAKVSFNVSVTTTTSQRVALALSGVPAGWRATLHGGGFVIDGVWTQAGAPAAVVVDVAVPTTATAGKTTITLTGIAASASDALPLELKVEPPTGGVTMDSDFSALRGPSDTSFTFTLTISNNTAQDLTFAVNATGPDGWTTNATWSGQAQAASAVVKSYNTAAVSVSVKPPAGVAAGGYRIAVEASAGATKVQKQLEVTITGRYSMSLTTPDQVLSTRGSAGSEITQQFVVRNGGTAPLTNVELSASAPTNWTVAFTPSSVESIAPNARATVTAKIVPAAAAIAGDYQVSVSARTDQTSASQDLRVTVETSLLFGLLGIVAIVAVLGVLGFVFQRYGRR